MIIKIKPLSVNNAWKGQRFKTSDYKVYEMEVYYKLPNKIVIPDKIKLNIEFGFSNINSDVDNPAKPFLDILQKKYNFNDSHIYKLILEKVKVNKGEEYIKFSFEEYDIQNRN